MGRVEYVLVRGGRVVVSLVGEHPSLSGVFVIDLDTGGVRVLREDSLVRSDRRAEEVVGYVVQR